MCFLVKSHRGEGEWVSAIGNFAEFLFPHCVRAVKSHLLRLLAFSEPPALLTPPLTLLPHSLCFLPFPVQFQRLQAWSMQEDLSLHVENFLTPAWGHTTWARILKIVVNFSLTKRKQMQIMNDMSTMVFRFYLGRGDPDDLIIQKTQIPRKGWRSDVKEHVKGEKTTPEVERVPPRIWHKEATHISGQSLVVRAWRDLYMGSYMFKTDCLF